MPISFYDQPAQSNLINTYVQAPFQEILQAGLARQGRYDETLASLDANQEFLDQIQAIPGAQTDYINQSRKSIESIASGYANKDLSDAFTRRQLRDEIRRKIDPASINTIIQSKKNYDDAQKMKAELDARGLYYEPFDRANDPAINGTLKAGELYQYTPRAFQDPEKVAGAYFESIQPDTQIIPDDRTGMVYERTSRSLNKLKGAVENDWRTFADTPQGQWVIDQYKRRNPNDKTGDADIVKGYLNDVAKRYVYTKDNYAGAIPGWVKRNSQEQIGPRIPLSGVAVPGVAERKPAELISYSANRKKLAELNDQLLSNESNLRVASEANKPAIQGQISTIKQQIKGLEKARDAVYDQSGLNVTQDRYNEVLGSVLKRHKKLTPNEQEAVEEIGNLLLTSRLGFLDKTANSKLNIVETMGDRQKKAVEYLEQNYPGLENKSVNRILRASEDWYQNLKDAQPSKREQKEAFKSNAITEESHPGIIAPVTAVRSGVDYLTNPLTGEADIPSNTQVVLKGIQGNPERFELSIYDAKKQTWETVKDKKDKDEFNAGKFLQYEILPLLPNEKGAHQLEFKLKDENDKVGEKLYRISLNDPTQLGAIARDYINTSAEAFDTNFMIGYRLTNSNISSEYMTQKHNDTKEINIRTLDGTIDKAKVIVNDDGTQSIIVDDKIYLTSNDQSKFNNDEEVLEALYELQINNDPSFREQ